MTEVKEQEYSKTEVHHMSIKEMFLKYMRFWPLFVVSIALAMLCSWAYLRWATPIYQSSGVLLVQSDENPSGLDKLEQAMTVDPMKNVQTEIEILRSRPMMERVVKARDLNFSYSIKGKMKDANAYNDVPFRIEALKINNPDAGFSLNLVFPDDKHFKLDGSPRLYSFGETFSTAHGNFRLNKIGKGFVEECRITWTPTLNQAMTLINSLEISPKLNTGIVNITMRSTSPLLAADVVNQLMEEYRNMNLEEKNISTTKKLQFVEEELKVISGELDSINNLLVAYREKYKIVDPKAQSDTYLARIEGNLEKMNEQRVQMGSIGRLEDFIRRNPDAPVPFSLGVDDPTLKSLFDTYNELQLERRALLNNAPPGNLVVQEKKAQAEATRQNILESIRNVKSSFNAMVGSLKSGSNFAESKVSAVPAKERDLEKITRGLESKMEIYKTMFASKEQAAIALASNISNTKIVQEALPDPTPVKPKRGTIRFIALLFGILIPISIVIIMELLNDKVTSRNEIEKLTQAPILGEIGHSTGNEPLVVTKGSRKAISEQFRILRSNLQFVLRNAEKPVILVTSSFSGEGKSFVSTNAGAVMSLMNKKTIILEFDIRKPKVLSHLRLSNRYGLSNYLLGNVSEEELPMKVPGYDNLYVLPCGPLHPNPAEVLLDPKLDDLFAYLKRNFDVVVMDTAPVGMVSDAMTLSRFADCTLFIVRQGHTYKKQVAQVDQYYRESRLPKISIVINDVKATAGYYGSENGYGSGYFEDDDVPVKSQIHKWFGWLNLNGAENKIKRTTKV